MTDILPAHKALIEAALAWREAFGNGWDRRLVEAIDAYRSLDDGSTLARWAAIGEAVERMDNEGFISWSAHRFTNEMVGPWLVAWVGHDGNVRSVERQPTLPAAIEAALGEP